MDLIYSVDFSGESMPGFNSFRYYNQVSVPICDTPQRPLEIPLLAVIKAAVDNRLDNALVGQVIKDDIIHVTVSNIIKATISSVLNAAQKRISTLPEVKVSMGYGGLNYQTSIRSSRDIWYEILWSEEQLRYLEGTTVPLYTTPQVAQITEAKEEQLVKLKDQLERLREQVEGFSLT